MIKYRTRMTVNNQLPKIDAIKIEKESSCYVYLPQGAREKKRTTEWNNYFDSREQAVEFIKDSALQKIRVRKKDIENMEKDIAKLEKIINGFEGENE